MRGGCAVGWLVVFVIVALVDVGLGQIDELSLANFNLAVSQGKSLVVLHDPKCQACKTFESEALLPAMTTLEQEGFGVYKVDSIKHELLALRFSVQAFPTVVRFIPGEACQQYTGDFKAVQVIEFAKGGLGKDIPARGLLGHSSLLWRLPPFLLTTLAALHTYITKLGLSDFAQRMVGGLIGFVIPLVVLLPLILISMVLYVKYLDSKMDAAAEASIRAHKKAT